MSIRLIYSYLIIIITPPFTTLFFQAVFKCQIDCVPPPKVQWFKDGTEITKDARVKCYKVTEILNLTFEI